jgi:biotin synthase
MDCKFCSLTQSAGIFKERTEFPLEDIVAWAERGAKHGVDALNLMTTGTYSFKKLLEVARVLRKKVAIPLVANTRDIHHREGEQLLAAGFAGCYHSVRLGEGRDTPFKRDRRIKSIEVFRDVGLRWMNCIEPVGPEHTAEEIVDLMLLARDFGATYSGVMRRINFPGSPMEPYGMISDLTMAKLVAVSRLVMGDVPRAHCTHEPHEASLMAGANLFFPEVGSNPRDRSADTGKGRGVGIPECRRFLQEMDWNPDLPSNCFEA